MGGTGLFDYCTGVTDFSYTFSNCTELSGNAPNLWVIYSGANGVDCFYTDTNLDNYYTEIPTSWGGGYEPTTTTTTTEEQITTTTTTLESTTTTTTTEELTTTTTTAI